MTNKVDFYKLPLGAWFKYPASNRVHVKLDSNKVAAISDTYDDRTQEFIAPFHPTNLITLLNESNKPVKCG